MKSFYKKAFKSKILLLTVILFTLLNISVVQGMQLQQEEPVATPEATPLLPEPSISVIIPTEEMPEVNTYVDNAVITFKEMGSPTVALRYPASHYIEMPLPNTWVVIGEDYSYINLHYDLFDERTAAQDVTRRYEDIGYPHVAVYVDSYLAATFIPEAGRNHSIRIPIPSIALIYRDFNPTNFHSLEIEFYNRGDEYCYYEGVLTIHEDSLVNLTFTTRPQKLDLADFPTPIVQDTFIPETLYFVLPDNYTGSDIAVAATIGSAITKGSVTNVKYKVITAAEATQEVIGKSNAVIIGKTGENALINQLSADNYLFTVLSSDKTQTEYLGKPVDPNVGILQLIPNQYNNEYNFLVVTGNSDESLLRGAKELLNPRLGLKGQFALVQPPVTEQAEINIDAKDTFTFEELGIEERTWYGLESYTTTYTFFIPNHWKIEEGVNLVLKYAHSDNLSTQNSALSVRINGRLVGNADIDSSLLGDKQVTIPINPAFLIPGYQNVLTFNAHLAGRIECANVISRTHWITIRNTSFFQIKHQALSKGIFIHPTFHLLSDPRIMFVLPPDPSQDEINGLMNLALLVGREDPRFVDFQVTLDPNLELSQYPEYHVVLFGKPSRNPQIVKLNELLPQPFVPGEDSLMQTSGGIAYRISPGVSIGVVEVMPAAWNATRGITIISGTTDEGFNYAIKAIISPDRFFDFAGDVYFISDTRLESIYSSAPVRDTVDQIVATVANTESSSAETVEPIPTSTPQPEATEIQVVDKYISTIPSEKPIISTGVYVLYGLIGFAVIILILGIIRAARGGRSL